MAKKSQKSQTRVRHAAPRAAPTRPTRGRRAQQAAGSSYHHGALRDALLEAAERVLERDGLPGLTLRAVAR